MENKFLKFRFKAVCYLNNFKTPLGKVDELSFLLLSEISNHIISACVNIGFYVNIGRGVNVGCDRCFYIAFINKLHCF